MKEIFEIKGKKYLWEKQPAYLTCTKCVFYKLRESTEKVASDGTISTICSDIHGVKERMFENLGYGSFIEIEQ